MKRLISIVSPVYNESETIPVFYQRLKAALEPLRERYDFELLFTNNASEDGTLEVILQLRREDPSVQVLTFSRNFGYQASVFAGLKNARGTAVVVIDVDCEDPPELIPRFIEEWEKGYDVVYGRRGNRPEFIGLRMMRRAFYRLTRLIADYDFVLFMAEFFLVTAPVRDAMLDNASTFPFLRAELGFVGFRRQGIDYDRQKRAGGRSHYNFARMARFALAGILSSSTFPLRMIAYVGLPLAAADAALAIVAALGDVGRALGVVVLANLAFVCASLAFLAVYSARTYKDGVRRPIYVVDARRSHLNGEGRLEEATVAGAGAADRP
jgi:dolichol-phosphate mannosyltransferase